MVFDRFWHRLSGFGVFLSGGATVSNLIFSGVQYDVVRSLGLDPVSLLSLQTLGASIGNMIALHNVIAALTIAGLSEAESYRVIRANLIPVGLLLLVFGLIGLAIT